MKITSFKKIILASALLAFSTTLFAEKMAVDTDDYTEEVPEEKTSIKLNSKDSKDKKKKPKKSASEAVKEFIFGKEKYVFYDTMNLSTGTILAGIRQREVELILKPTTREAGVRTYFESSWYDLLFDEANRTKIIDSIDKYLSDFENHKLNKKATYLKTRRTYCTNGKCFKQWGSTKQMMSSFGHTTFDCGYEFKKVKDKTSPFFAIIIHQTKDENDKNGTNTSPESTEVSLFLTKSQAKTLAELLGREKIVTQMNLYYEAENTAVDDYNESSDSDEYSEQIDEVKDNKESDVSEEETVSSEAEDSASSEEETVSSEADETEKEPLKEE